MKSPTEGDLFDFPGDLEPDELRVEVRKDPAIFNLACHASLLFEGGDWKPWQSSDAERRRENESAFSPLPACGER
jgi:hypothetical protein